MHTINTFLFGDEGSFSRGRLDEIVKRRFGDIKGVEFSELWRPFGVPAALKVSFDQKWFFTVNYFDGADVRESVDYVQDVTSTKLPVDRLLGEVRTSFAHDKNLDFDHITVYMYELLGSLPGAVVYDDNHKSFVWPVQQELPPNAPRPAPGRG